MDQEKILAQYESEMATWLADPEAEQERDDELQQALRDEELQQNTDFHAVYGEYKTVIDIESGDILSGRLPKRAQALVAEW